MQSPTSLNGCCNHQGLWLHLEGQTVCLSQWRDLCKDKSFLLESGSSVGNPTKEFQGFLITWGGHKAPVPPLPLAARITSGTLARNLHWRVGLMPGWPHGDHLQPCGASHRDLQSFGTPWSCWSLCCLGWQIEAQTSQRVKGSRVGVSDVSGVSVALQKCQTPETPAPKFHKDQHSVNCWSFQTLFEKIQSSAILQKIRPKEMWP